jgi:hypothetical protein
MTKCQLINQPLKNIKGFMLKGRSSKKRASPALLSPWLEIIHI